MHSGVKMIGGRLGTPTVLLKTHAVSWEPAGLHTEPQLVKRLEKEVEGLGGPRR